MGWVSLEAVERYTGELVSGICNWYVKHKTVFWAAYAVTLIAYSYFFTAVSFTNHTFPQTWTYSFPSYRTLQEGRWFSDLLLWALGGSGVQSSQMYVAAGLHIVNAIVVAEIFGVEGKMNTFLAAALLSVYPAFLDRYCFPGSQITFVVTDSLAVFALFVLSRQNTQWKVITGVTLLLILCLSSYQPGIALASFLVLAHCILEVIKTQDGDTSSPLPVKQLITAATSMLFAAVGYFVIVKITTPLGMGERTHLNSISEVVQQIQYSYPAFIKYFSAGSDYLPKSLRWLPLVVVLSGAASIVLSSLRKGVISTISVVVLLGLMPIALRASYIINNQTFSNVGRIIYPYAFALLFFLLIIQLRPKLRWFSQGATLVLFYCSIIVATQETNAAYLKMLFDTNKINRIAGRIESIVPDLYAMKRPVVVVGRLTLETQNMKSFPNLGNFAHSNTETFDAYRQPEIFNFYFGREVFERPTVQQRDEVLSSINGRRPWPAPESVFLHGDIVVVLLENYKKGSLVTWTQ